MSFRSTLIIFILLVGIATTYYIFFNEPAKNISQDSNKTISDTYNLSHDNINQVKIVYSDNAYQRLELQRKPVNTWQITKPFIAHANTEKILLLLDDLLNKKIKQNLEVSEYKQYGLEQPTIKVELWKNPKDTSTTFLIGKKGVNYSVYIKEQSEAHIFLIESSILDQLTIAPADIRDKSVIKFNPNSIVELQYQKPEKLTCKKDGDRWKMIHPLSVNADSNEISYLLSELQSYKVTTFEADGENVTTLLQKYGLDEPRIELSLNDSNSTYKLAIGADVQTTTDTESADKQYVYVHAIHQDGIYTVTEKIVRLLNKTVFDLRDKRVLDFQRGDTVQFEIQKGTQKVVGIKLDDVWELQGKVKTLADSQVVSDLLFGVDSLEAVKFITNSDKKLDQFGLDLPTLRVKFTIQDVEQPAELLIGNFTEDDTVYVKSNTSDQVSQVKRQLIDNIAKGESWLRNKQIFNFSIDEPIRVTVKYSDTTNEDVNLTCQRLANNWRLTTPIKEDANNVEVNKVLYGLIDLRADEFVGSSFENSYSVPPDTTMGFNSPQIQINVELRTKKVYTLQIGNIESSSNYYARLKNQPDWIFLINEEHIPKLKTKLEWLRVTDLE